MEAHTYRMLGISIFGAWGLGFVRVCLEGYME